MKKLIAVIIFLVSVSGFYYLHFEKPRIEQGKNGLEYVDKFDTLNQDFWYVGEWLTTFEASEKVEVKNGFMTLAIEQEDRGPYLLSKGISVKKGDVLKVSRRAKLHYSNERFTAGMALVESPASGLSFVANNESFSKNIGSAVGLVEYVHNYDLGSKRPGRDVFRVMSPYWDTEGAYALLEPKFDDWFEETLTYDTNTSKLIYELNGQKVSVKTCLLEEPYIRVFIHSYGQGVGHSLKMDDFSIKLIKGKDKE